MRLIASLFLVVRPGAPSSVLAPSSDARSPVRSVQRRSLKDVWSVATKASPTEGALGVDTCHSKLQNRVLLGHQMLLTIFIFVDEGTPDMGRLSGGN